MKEFDAWERVNVDRERKGKFSTYVSGKLQLFIIKLQNIDIFIHKKGVK